MSELPTNPDELIDWEPSDDLRYVVVQRDLVDHLIDVAKYTLGTAAGILLAFYIVVKVLEQQLNSWL